MQKCSGRHNVMCTKADGQWLVQQPGKCRWPAASIITTHFPHVATDIRLLASPKCVVIVLRAYNSPKINPSHPPHSDEGEEEGWESMHAHAQQNGFMDVVGYCARAGALTGRCHKTPAVERAFVKRDVSHGSNQSGRHTGDCHAEPSAPRAPATFSSASSLSLHSSLCLGLAPPQGC